jgi:eukaryotic-like serine/threonine-protein kinase
MTGWSVPGVVHLRVMREDPMGQRVLARHRMTRKSLAITYLSAELLADTEFRARFGDECARLTRVRDARVARIHHYVECDHGAAVVGEDINGTSLRSLLLAQGAVGTEAALVVLKDVLLALAACHEAGVAHGDVKPEDVILTPAGRVRLVDAGLWSTAGRQQLVRSTPFYLAPEQWSGSAASRTGADVYAATATFFESLVGAPPFYATGVAELSAKHQGGVPPVEVVPAPVRELVLRGLAKDPRSRGGARNLVALVGDVASRAAGSGWERRGRQELAALLTNRGPLPAMPAPSRESGITNWLGCRRPVRLAAVVGGALALATGLSSPPLVVIPGINILVPSERPPVLAFPELDRGRAAAMRVVTNSPLGERAPAPATKGEIAWSVAGGQLPASSVAAPAVRSAPDKHAVPSARYQGAAPNQAALAPPACNQHLVNDHKPCIAMNPERPTPGSADAPSDPSEVTIPVSVSIPVSLPVQLTAPASPVQSPLLASPSKDIHLPERPLDQNQLSRKTARASRLDTIGNSTKQPTSRSRNGFGTTKDSGHPRNR